MSLSSPSEELAVPSSPPPTSMHAATVAPREEDASRRRKFFSLPVVAIHTALWTTKSNVVNKG